jgi:ketosteroid isomerase-like protein
MAEDRARRFIDALHTLEETGDVEALAALHAEGADISNPLVPHRHHGPDGARAFWSSYRSTFDTVRSEFHHVQETGGVAFLEWTSAGRSAQGKDFRYRGVSVLEWDGDQLRAFRTYFDPHHLGRQITATQA